MKIFNYIKFIEAKLSDISKFKLDPSKKSSDEFLKKITYKNLNDVNFKKFLTPKKYYNGKKTQWKLKWYHDMNHDLIDRISSRTSIKSISEFNDIFTDSINRLIPDYLISGEIEKNGRYSIYLSEYNISLIINLDIIKHEIMTISIVSGLQYNRCLKVFHF
jgi:hypothetical protein